MVDRQISSGARWRQKVDTDRSGVRLMQLLAGFDITQLGIDLGSGALIGAVVGFAFKKVAKLVAVLIGLELALFKFLESRGILTVDWDALSAGLLGSAEGAAATTPPGWVMSLLGTLSVSAGFTGGFLLGFRKG
jgi:uncharacterized membrane protein (Fun14 family)